MQLLTPETVKNDTSRQEQEQRSRVRDLSMEEERLVKSVNLLREEEKAEKKRIDEELEVNQATLATRKTMLVREVEALEARKAESLKPAREIEERANKILAENEEKSKVLDTRLSEVATMKENVLVQLEKIDDKKQLLAEADEALLIREKGITAGEAEVKRSANEVADKWLQYHGAVIELNNREHTLVSRENAVTVATEANTVFKLTLEAKEKDLAERERALNDKYQTFISAQKEMGKI